MEILHITRKADWSAALNAGAYSADSLATEGFIHCSTTEQVARTANKFYAGQSDLVLLHIDTDRLAAELRWEAADGDMFPHIYGPLNLDAVQAITDFTPAANGLFHYP
jgi:uncharacterized protein (DUF952 family)